MSLYFNKSISKFLLQCHYIRMTSVLVSFSRQCTPFAWRQFSVANTFVFRTCRHLGCLFPATNQPWLPSFFLLSAIQTSVEIWLASTLRHVRSWSRLRSSTTFWGPPSIRPWQGCGPSQASSSWLPWPISSWPTAIVALSRPRSIPFWAPSSHRLRHFAILVLLPRLGVWFFRVRVLFELFSIIHFVCKCPLVCVRFKHWS